jgi:hypothetical protein
MGLQVRQPMESRATTPLVLGLSFLFLGVILTYFGYLWGEILPNPSELVGSFLFWSGLVYLLLVFPLRGELKSLSRYLRTVMGASVFVGYVAVHLVLYGFLLDEIIASVFGSSSLAVNQAFFVSTNVFLPPSFLNAMFDLAYNPSIIVAVPPIFSAALTFYAISVALVIGILVVVSVGKTREIGSLCSRGNKAKSFVLLPAIGVVLGASCCLSVAGLVGLVVPSIADLASILWVSLAIYFLLPSFAMLLLYLNLRSIEGIFASLTSAEPGAKAAVQR